eukprot:7895425-Lingulodinium_polyedra.AAC.1
MACRAKWPTWPGARHEPNTSAGQSAARARCAPSSVTLRSLCPQTWASSSGEPCWGGSAGTDFAA